MTNYTKEKNIKATKHYVSQKIVLIYHYFIYDVYQHIIIQGEIIVIYLANALTPFDSPVIISLLVIQVLLTFFALIDWVKQEHTRGPKIMWLFIILLISMLGPVLYFVIGKKE